MIKKKVVNPVSGKVHEYRMFAVVTNLEKGDEIDEFFKAHPQYWRKHSKFFLEAFDLLKAKILKDGREKETSGDNMTVAEMLITRPRRGLPGKEAYSDMTVVEMLIALQQGNGCGQICLAALARHFKVDWTTMWRWRTGRSKSIPPAVQDAIKEIYEAAKE